MARIDEAISLRGVNYFAQSDMTVLRWLCIDSVIACQCPFKSF